MLSLSLGGAFVFLNMIRFDIVSIFPDIFDSYFQESIIKRARARKLLDIRVHNLRDFTKDTHHKVDDTPYGGGAGMVFKAEPIIRAVEFVTKKLKQKAKIVFLSAKGKQYTQKTAQAWAQKYPHILFVSGRYEGIDERAIVALDAEEISIGPYVLTDGDVAAMVLISSLARLVPGVITFESLREESHWSALLKKENGNKKTLEYPHYTRPDVFAYKGKKYSVPKVLLSGDHKKIGEWRRKHLKNAA